MRGTNNLQKNIFLALLKIAPKIVEKWRNTSFDEGNK